MRWVTLLMVIAIGTNTVGASEPPETFSARYVGGDDLWTPAGHMGTQGLACDSYADGEHGVCFRLPAGPQELVDFQARSDLGFPVPGRVTFRGPTCGTPCSGRGGPGVWSVTFCGGVVDVAIPPGADTVLVNVGMMIDEQNLTVCGPSLPAGVVTATFRSA